MRTYKNYEYEIIPIEIEVYTGRHEEHPRTKTGYEFIIYDVYKDGIPECSEEWYDTESEAVIMAEDKIGGLCE